MVYIVYIVDLLEYITILLVVCFKVGYMFVKKTKGGSENNPKIYYQLTESYREKGKKYSKHRVYLNLGSEEELIKNGKIDEITECIASIADNYMIINKNEPHIKNIKLLGPILALEAAWKKLQMENHLKQMYADSKIQYDFGKAVKLLVLNKLCDPKSKLAINKWKNSLYSEDYKDITLNHLYKCLDRLADNKEILEKKLYDTTIELFKPNINLVFYDLTTMYFESQNEDDLRRFGYSKDNKTDCTQVVMAMAVTEDNLPLGYELYEGNTYEGSTVTDLIKKLKYKYEIEKIVVVGDKGILSKKILSELDDNGYEYIVAAKVSKLPEKYHDEILDLDSYTRVNDELCIKEMEYEDRRLILCYSEKRAKRDENMRTMVLEKLNKRIKTNPKGLTSSPAYKKYLNMDVQKVEIADDKVEKHARWDGFFGFYTNNEEFTGEYVLNAYKMLWQIEESFRVMKSTLNLRPIYHWTSRRIKGHIAMCYLSFYVGRYIQKVLAEKDINITIESCFDSLSEIHAVELQGVKKLFHTRSEIEGLNNKILRGLGCKIPSYVLKEENL